MRRNVASDPQITVQRLNRLKALLSFTRGVIPTKNVPILHVVSKGRKNQYYG